MLNMDIVDVMQPVAIGTLAIVLYVLIFHENVRQQQHDHYSVANWNFFIKKLWASRQLRKRRPKQRQPFYESDFLNFNSERHKQLIVSEQHPHNSHLLFGSDARGNSLLVNISNGNDGLAEVWLVLRLKDKGVYTLPNHPSTVIKLSADIPCTPGTKINVAGLTFECIIPYCKWRITYTGPLRRGSQTDCNENELEDADMEFVKFNFFWTQAAEPLHWPYDWSIKMQASALAQEPWRNGRWLDYLSIPSFSGYDQFGSLYGQVHLESETSALELNLPGLRQMRWGNRDEERLRRIGTICGVCADGTVYTLGAFSLKYNLTHAQFGFIRTPNGNVSAIDWTDFQLDRLAEDPTNIPKGVSIRFTSKGTMYSTSVYFKRNDVIPLFGAVAQTWSGNIVPIETGVNTSNGDGVIILRYSSQRVSQQMATPFLDVPQLLNRNEKPKKMLLVYRFDDMFAQSVAATGGKGSSLAMLTAASGLMRSLGHSYQVPAGFVITVAAYEMQMNRNRHLVEWINEIEARAYERTANGSVEEACVRTVEAIEACELEAEIIEAITEHINGLREGNGGIAIRMAVRSSAIGEDGEDASAAGQNETFLGVQDLDGIFGAIRKCWASLYTYRSVEYRRQHVQPIRTEMAVVVQTMVDSECAGVLFTKHPANGDPSKVLITANYGLGESVVSGTVDPDTYTIFKNYKNSSFKIVDIHLGSKSHSIKMLSGSDANGITTSEISLADKSKACLSDENALKLAKLGVVLEQLYGGNGGRDIEWAVADGEIYLLQARPITTLNAMSNWELLHEADTAVMSDDDTFSFANVGEVFPAALTPLTNSTIIAQLQAATNRSFPILTKRPHQFSNNFVISHYRLQFDIYKMFLLMRNKTITNTDRMQMATVTGNDYLNQEIHNVSVHRNGIVTKSTQLIMMHDIFKSVWGNKALVKRLAKFIATYSGRFSSENLNEFREHDAAAMNTEINFELEDCDRIEEAFYIHSNSSKVASVTQLIAMAILIEGSPNDLTAEQYADFGSLLSSCNEVESAEVPQMLDDIFNAVCAAGMTNEFEKISAESGVDWLRENCPEAARLFASFIKRHGHRAFMEFELRTDTWGMKPEQIVVQLQTMCRHASVAKGERKTMTNAELIQSLRTPKKGSTRKILARVLPLCKMSVQRRETTKSCIISYIHEIRKAYRYLAELLIHEGLLPHRDLIYFLTKQELSALINSSTHTEQHPINASTLINKAQRRRRQYDSWTTHRFKELNMGVLKPINDDDDDDGPIGDDDASALVRGTAVSEGVVTGRAAVIRSFGDVHLICAGDILVTHATDIGWSPYFPIVSGVVTELGGLISHGAVVAREYGLPCIVGATDAMRKFKFGDIVTLNASKGIIYRVSGEEDALK